MGLSLYVFCVYVSFYELKMLSGDVCVFEGFIVFVLNDFVRDWEIIVKVDFMCDDDDFGWDIELEDEEMVEDKVICENLDVVVIMNYEDLYKVGRL